MRLQTRLLARLQEYTDQDSAAAELSAALFLSSTLSSPPQSNAYSTLTSLVEQYKSITTVEPPNKGHWGSVPCREVVPISEVK